MKKFSVVALLVLALISLNACRKVIGKGPVVTEQRNTGNFSGIRFDLPGDLDYVQSDEYKIEIEAQQNIINVIETNVSDGELRIKIRNNTLISSRENIRVTVSAPSVTSLSVSGSGNINVRQPYTPANSKMNVSGSGKILIQRLDTKNIDATVSGSGDVLVLGGTAEYEDFSVSGSGSIDMLNLAAKKAATHTSGSGSIKLNVSDDLNARISGSGTVYYQGDPVINSSISGSGRLVRL